MGLTYSQSESQELQTVLETNLKAAQEITDRLSHGSTHLIESLGEGTDLSGAAYNAGKTLFSDLIDFVIQRFSQAVDDVEKDLASYKKAENIVADETILSEDSIIRMLELKNNDLDSLEMQLQANNHLLYELPFIGDDIENWLAPDNAELKRMIAQIERDILKEQNKLKKLYAFDDQTFNLFQDSLAALNYALQGIETLSNTMVDSFGNYYLPENADMSWYKNLFGVVFSSALGKNAEYEKNRAKFLRRKAAYQKALEKFFEFDKDGTIRKERNSLSQTDFIMKMLFKLELGQGLSEAELAALRTWLLYKVGTLSNLPADNLKTVCPWLARAARLLGDKALAATFDSFSGKTTQEIKELLERGGFDSVKGLVSQHLGFEYQPDGDYYYTNEHSLQSQFGFGDNFEYGGSPLGMDLDTAVFAFEVNGKKYRLQLWKGTYGFGQGYGSEVGWYVDDPNKDLDKSDKFAKEIGGKDWAPAAAEKDQIRIENEMRNKSRDKLLVDKNDTGSYADAGDHFWNLQIKTDPNQTKNNFYNKTTLHIPDPDVRQAVYYAMSTNGGVSKLEIDNVEGTVSYTWGL
ncbi:hypothetical protein RyT2_17070 [Pseudolactococcus yaeyamensis]